MHAQSSERRTSPSAAAVLLAVIYAGSTVVIRSRKLAISLLMPGLPGAAFRAADQTEPGASHGPSGKESGVGGAADSASAAGKGTTQGSGGMQPRTGGGNSRGATSPSTGNGGAQDW